MNVWSLPCGTLPGAAGDAAPPLPGAAALGAMAGLVAGIGGERFADTALRQLNDAQLHAASWAVYRTWSDRQPVLLLSASLGVADTTGQCFAAYRDGLYRRDHSFDAVARGRSAVIRMHADEAPSEHHRDAIYRRHRVLERLSVVQRDDDGSLLAVNVYHHEHQGRFGEGEVAGFAALAPLLLAAVQRHVALADGATGRGAAAGRTSDAAPRQALLARCPGLTPRELDVCERLLRGWTYDGIAADLGLSVATVKTYRVRAFERLGMHFKSELFAAFI